MIIKENKLQNNAKKGNAADSQCFDCGLKAKPSRLSVPQGPKASTEQKVGDCYLLGRL